jgi:hypothetical protein
MRRKKSSLIEVLTLTTNGGRTISKIERLAGPLFIYARCGRILLTNCLAGGRFPGKGSCSGESAQDGGRLGVTA